MARWKIVTISKTTVLKHRCTIIPVTAHVCSRLQIDKKDKSDSSEQEKKILCFVESKFLSGRLI